VAPAGGVEQSHRDAAGARHAPAVTGRPGRPGIGVSFDRPRQIKRDPPGRDREHGERRRGHVPQHVFELAVEEARVHLAGLEDRVRRERAQQGQVRRDPGDRGLGQGLAQARPRTRGRSRPCTTSLASIGS
jgi:hypothetical protein